MTQSVWIHFYILTKPDFKNICWHHARYSDISVDCNDFDAGFLITYIPICDCRHDGLYITVVKELRSKIFGQHPGYYRAVFLKKTQMIIVRFYKYTVYKMFWILFTYWQIRFLWMTQPVSIHVYNLTKPDFKNICWHQA
jgi:hypothetical protein